MPGVDTSIYGNIQQTSPMAGIGTMLDMQGKALNNKLLQLQTLGVTSEGQAYKDAINPDGSFDINKFYQSLSKNPAGFAGAAAGVPSAVNTQAGQISNTTGSVNLNQLGLTNVGAKFGARLSTTTGLINRDDLIGDITDLTAQGRVPSQIGKALIQQLYTVPDDQLRTWATSGYLQALPPGLVAGAAPAPPAPNGAPRQQTVGQFVGQSVGGTAPAGTTTSPVSTAAGPSPAVAPGGPSGALPAAGAAPGAIPTATPAAGTAPRASPAPATVPGITTGLGPGATQALADTGTASSAQFTSLRNIANSVPDRKALLNNMLADAAKFSSGPLTTELTKALEGANQVFGTNFNVEGNSAVDSFNKWANQIALAQSQSIGATDLTTTTAMGANPNAQLSNLGINRIIAMLKGNEDAIAAKNKAGNEWLKGHTPDTFGNFSTDFNAHYDPRVFQSEYWDDKTTADVFKAMSPAEHNKFVTDYNYAVAQGWIPDPRGGK